LANALDDPAMDLALEQERVNGAPEIVDDGVALDYHDAGIGIDLDLDDVAAVGEGLSWRYAVMLRIEPRLHARRQFRGIARRLRHGKTVGGDIGTGPAKYPTDKASVLRLVSKRVRSQLRAFVLVGAPRLVGRRPGGGRRTRTAAKP